MENSKHLKEVPPVAKNRKIKFRAWDKINEKWLDTEDGLTFTDDTSSMPWEMRDVVDNPDFIVQQFTGLKDKNGKEIYEGDVLKESDHKFAIKYGYGEWNCGCCGYVYGFDFSYAEKDNSEIVGNIIENPELLK